MPEDVEAGGALERFIAALRRTEPADPRRVSRVVRAAVGGSGSTFSWWARRRTLTGRALTGLASAAAVAGLVLGGALNSALRGDAPATASAPAGLEPLPIPLYDVATGADVGDRPLSVQFALIAPEARSVALVGDFNGWDPAAEQLSPGQGGIWSGTVMLPPGRHAYAFIVDDSIWTPDPKAPLVEDADFGRPHSVRVFGGM